MLLGCILVSEAELAARYDVDGDGVPWPDDCDDRDASVSTCEGSADPPPAWREGEGDYGHDVALLVGGHAAVGAPSEATAHVDDVALRGPSSCASGGDGAGWSVAGVADLDGDGRGELLVGGPALGAGGGCAGAAWILNSGAWTEGAVLAEAGATVNGVAPGDGLGFAVAAADLDGDGIDELLLGAPVAGALYALSADLDAGSSVDAASSEAWTAPGAGFGVRAAGDVDGDGRGDAVVTTDAGVVVLGGAHLDILATVPGVGGCGPRCATGSIDLDGDERADLAVGDSANLYLLPGAALSGTVEATDVATSVVLGTAVLAVAPGGDGALLGEASGVFLVSDPPLGAVDLADAVAREYAPESPGADYGWALDGGIDLGLGAPGPDVVVGSPGEGRVYFFAGRE